tara:strand:+ start:50 stop:706 length:657 start_codon:yes stop_codon:yes gene_type:complete
LKEKSDYFYLKSQTKENSTNKIYNENCFKSLLYTDFTELNKSPVLIAVCTKLLKLKVGDKQKIEIIKARAEQGRITYELDKKYIEKFMAYYIIDEPPQQPPQQPPQPSTNFCKSCGTQVSLGEKFCTSCGSQNNNIQQSSSYNQQQGKPSVVWWLLPIFLTFLGGLISWLALKDRDPRMAKNTLILGIILSFVPLMILGIFYAGVSIASLTNLILVSE